VIILDTNVVSEVLKPAPQPRVLEWLAGQPRASLFITTVTRGEILYGVRLLPDGRRRRQLWEAAQAIFNEDFAGQALSFDNEAADEFADIAARRREAGRPISQLDAMIAAMSRSRGASLATRNAKDFEGCGIEVINPWTD
jgi:predicted nucleic acid-binding protein